MLKALLINPYPYYAKGIEGVVYPPVGLLYMSALAKKRGMGEVRVLDANILRMKNPEVIEEILEYSPEIIGISSNIVTHRSAIELMRLIRQNNLRQTLLAGGQFPALFPEKYLEHCDIVVNGEGEETFCEILNACQDKSDIFSLKGIIYKKGNEVISNPKRELWEELDEIPFPDYSSLKPTIDYYSKRSRVVKNIMAPLLTSRGCPYQCTYCNKSVFGSKFRYRSPENIVAEIGWLRNNFKVDQIDILDDNFNLIIDRAGQVLDRIVEKGLDIAISCHNGLRADKISESFARQLKRAGVFKVGLGIETADPDLMKKINKDLNLDKVKEAVYLLRKQGITVHGYFILGLPGDNPHSMSRTIKFAKEINPHFCNFAICIPFPGTEVYKQVKKEGRFLKDVDSGVSSGFFDGKIFFEIDGTKAEDVSFYYKKAYRQFYFNPRKALDILLSMRNFKELIWVVSTSLSLIVNTLSGLRHDRNENK